MTNIKLFDGGRLVAEYKDAMDVERMTNTAGLTFVIMKEKNDGVTSYDQKVQVRTNLKYVVESNA